jgi:hypothetical protein
MGITKSFFNSPVIVPVTLRQKVEKDGEFYDVDHQIVFVMNRETVAQRNGAAVAASLFNSSDNLQRFSKMLAVEPKGIDDFPKDERALSERALEYFEGEGYNDLLQYVVMEVERAQKPLEFFRGF